MRNRPRHPAIPRRPRRGLAWLAVVALLVNALLPGALLAAGPPSSPGTVAGFCRSGSGEPLPGQHPAGVPAHHCMLCAIAAPGLVPIPVARLPLPRLAAAAGPLPALLTVPPRLLPFPAAFPRGPPTAA